MSGLSKTNVMNSILTPLQDTELPMALLRVRSAAEGGAIDVGIVDMHPGELTYEFPTDEAVYFLEGTVAITIAGELTECSAGDLVCFRKGEIGTWKVRSKVRGLFVASAQ